MKSAEEWLKENGGIQGEVPALISLDQIGEIQADALRGAADIISGYDVGYDAKTGEGWRTRKEIGELVLAEADRIEKGNRTT